ncbi:MAG: TonB-dependent receptor family protein [Akkermansiaceae bacterium]
MKFRQTYRWLAAFASAGSLAQAQDSASAENMGLLEPLVVIGGEEEVYNLAGSAAYLDASEWRSQGYTNINRMLLRVPGVYVREEDGFGNFPNISMRGADGTRSEKVTLMEDGILAAPAPYSAPSAYYSPRASRMSALEILKGSSQVKYGPQTTSGVINYISTQVPTGGPDDPNFYWRSTYGTDNTFFNHLYYGDTVQTSNGTFGYLFELLHESSDGYRDLDGGGNTGFEVFEPMIKLFWEPDTALKQRFEFRYGYTDLDADETYVGLSEADFAANPFRRYAGTQFDNMTTEQNRTYFKWIAEPSENFSFETALYYNDFSRNWYKIRSIDVTNPADIALLNGSAPGTLSLRENLRTYESYGIQFSGLYKFETGSVSHDLGFGARWHYDEVRRFQRDDTITSAGTGAGGFRISSLGVPGSGGNRFQSAEAVSFWVTDDITIGDLTLSPGFRYEDVDLDNTDFASDPTNTPTDIRSGSESYFAPGIGFTYDLNDENRLFGGVFKGYSLASPRSILADGIEKEESIGYELGIRHRRDALNAEFVGFLTDFENLIATDNGFGVSNNNRNVGAAMVYGFEAFVGYDAGVDQGMEFNVPMYVSATWTSAELGSAVAAGGAENIYGGGMDGSNIPYVPEWKLAAGVGVGFEKWGANLDVSFQSSSFGTANNFSRPMTSQIQGKIDSAFLVDVSAYYQATDHLRIVGGIQNLLDEEILSSRIPIGARAAAPRSVFGGFEFTF